MSGTQTKLSFSTILDTALDAVVVMDRRGAIVDWNNVAAEIFGWTRTEAIGASLADLIVPVRLREAHSNGLKRFLDTGVGPVLRKRIEVTALRKGGEEFPVELSITPYEESGTLVFLGFLRDITERRENAARLENQARQAKVLYYAISSASSASSPEEALQTCLNAVHELTGWPLGHVYVPSSRHPNQLDPSGIWFPASGMEYLDFKEATARTCLPLGKGLPGLVWQSGEPQWIRETRFNARLPRADKMDNAGIRSAVAFPVKNGGTTIAVVEFFTPVQSEPDPNLLLILRSIGDQVGRVFERRLAEAKLQNETDRQKLLLAELNHRVKNMLTVVSGIASQTMRHTNSVASFNKDFLGRLHALSEAHSLLATQSWEETPLEALAEKILAPYRVESSRIKLGGPQLALTAKAALALSLVLHELVTNATKYGALAVPEGNIHIAWNFDEDRSSVLLEWRESGLAGLTKPSKTGFGTRLIDATIKHELRGVVRVRYERDGVAYSMRWPVELEAKGRRQ